MKLKSKAKNTYIIITLVVAYIAFFMGLIWQEYLIAILGIAYTTMVTYINEREDSEDDED